MKAIIIEDIPAELAHLKQSLAAYCPEVSVLGEANNVEEALRLIPQKKPELLLMDVEIMGGTSYDLLDQLQKQGHPLDFEIIFMTGHHKFDYATAAFAYSAIDFLTKPLDPLALQKAVKKAVERQQPQQNTQQFALLLDLLRAPNAKANRLAVHLVAGIIEFVEIDQIIYLEADGVLTVFTLKDKTQLKAARNLGQYVQILQREHRFFSISNSVLVNLDQMSRYDHSEKAVTMSNGKTIYASRRGGIDLRSYINEQQQNAESSKSGLLAAFKKLFGR